MIDTGQSEWHSFTFTTICMGFRPRQAYRQPSPIANETENTMSNSDIQQEAQDIHDQLPESVDASLD
ncbi:replication factor A, partial [Haloarcula marismortui ATCC 33799]